MTTSSSTESLTWAELGWAVLWFVLGVCLVGWGLFAFLLTAADLVLGFSSSTASDYVATVSFLVLSPLALGAAHIALRRRGFDIWSTAIICVTAVALMWNARLSDVAVSLDVLALVLVVAAIRRRNAGPTTAFVLVLGFALTLWLALDGKMTLYELT